MPVKYHIPEYLGSSKIPLDSNKFRKELDEASYALGLQDHIARFLKLSCSLKIVPLLEFMRETQC